MFPTNNICRDNDPFQEYFDYSSYDHNKLPFIDSKEEPDAKIRARNEVPLLKSVYDHPDVYTANSITGQPHQVVAVYDSHYGSKVTRVNILTKSVVQKPIDYINEFKDPDDNDDDDVSIMFISYTKYIYT